MASSSLRQALRRRYARVHVCSGYGGDVMETMELYTLALRLRSELEQETGRPPVADQDVLGLLELLWRKGVNLRPAMQEL